jgi:predicted PurR-regulated permease PerM
METGKTSKLLITTAAFIIVIAGMRAAQPILVPFLLSVFIAIICSPMLFWLSRKGLPTFLSLVLVITCILFTGILIGALIGTSIYDFSQSLPFYQKQLAEKTSDIISFLNRFDIKISNKMLMKYIDPSAAMGMVSKILTGLGNVLSNTFLIMLTVIFILLEASGFPAKLHSAFSKKGHSIENFEKFINNVNRYMALKTWISLGTGIMVPVSLLILGVDYPLLWGVIAFMFNYIPNIGSIIAAVPAVLLALVQHGVTTALLAGCGYLVLNIVIGSVIEPRFMGRGLGLSTLVVFLSLVFWGWVLGPVGMLLSIPLTMTVKIALSSSKETLWLNTLLGAAED